MHTKKSGNLRCLYLTRVMMYCAQSSKQKTKLAEG
jgi:hypothetical protein